MQNENNTDTSNNQKDYISNIEEHQYLTFLVSGEVFGIGVLSIKEIITYSNITQVPSMKKYIDGVTNVRGNIIPVIVLAERFGFKREEITNKTCIIIVTAEHEGQSSDLGIVVDKVNQVHDILPYDTEETPNFGTKINKNFLEFIGKVNGEFVSILNNQNILDIEELASIQEQRNFGRRRDDRR
jgi:purine-binding chemotaxis protein CheW